MNNKNVTLKIIEKKPVLKLFLVYFIPLFLFVTFVLIILLVEDYWRTTKLINSNEEFQISIMKKSMMHELEHVGPNINTLINSEGLQDYLVNPNLKNKRKLENSIMMMVSYKRIYDQIRYIDNNGQELLRIDYKNGKSVRIIDSQLQNKSDRYYFKKSLPLGKGDIYVSPLDLNVEHGKVEIPNKPMIRFVSPVFDREDNKRGVVVFNYLAERMLEHFDEMKQGSGGYVEIINHKGSWIRSHIKDKSFGFMFGKTETFQDAHSNIWPYILKQEDGRIKNKHGLYNFTTLNPIAVIRNSLSYIPDANHVVKLNENERKWKIISHVPRNVIFERLINDLRHISGPIWSIFVFVITIGSWRFAVNKVKHRQLQIEAELHAKVFAWANEGVTITDKNANILDINNGFSRITGYSRDEVLGENPKILSSGQQNKDFYLQMWSEIKKNGFWEGEIYNRRKDGQVYCEWLRIAAALDHKKRVNNYIALFSDITEKKKREDKLSKQAFADPLTGLSNRAALVIFLNQAFAKARQDETQIACLFFDLNKFKPINDRYGHAAGDAILQEVAVRLNMHTRDTDNVSRLGGDEFAIVLTDVTDRQDVEEIALRVQESLKQKIETTWGEFTIGASLGISYYPDDAKDHDSLIQFADKAMYDNKKESIGI